MIERDTASSFSFSILSSRSAITTRRKSEKRNEARSGRSRCRNGTSSSPLIVATSARRDTSFSCPSWTPPTSTPGRTHPIPRSVPRPYTLTYFSWTKRTGRPTTAPGRLAPTSVLSAVRVSSSVDWHPIFTSPLRPHPHHAEDGVPDSDLGSRPGPLSTPCRGETEPGSRRCSRLC